MKISELCEIIGWFWVAQAKKVYLCTMYVRKKYNRSGSTSVVVVSKASGKYKEIKLVGGIENRLNSRTLKTSLTRACTRIRCDNRPLPLCHEHNNHSS